MTNLDDKIRQAMRDDDALDQPGIIEMAAANFRGKQRLTTVLSIVVMMMMMAVMVWCAVAFFRATDVRDMILYASLFLFLGLAVAMMKLWFWLMMIRYSIARELKRLELQVSALQRE